MATLCHAGGYLISDVNVVCIPDVVASLMKFQDTPVEEWIARSIWGRASEQWGSIEKEQQALNKILLGLSVEFDYSQSLIENLNASAAAVDNPFALGDADKGYFKEARLRLLISEALKEKLQWEIDVYLHRLGGSKLLAYSIGNAVSPNAAPPYLEGVAEPEVIHHSSDLTIVTIQAQMSLYPSSSAVFKLYDDVSGGQLLSNEVFLVR